MFDCFDLLNFADELHTELLFFVRYQSVNCLPRPPLT